VFRIGMHEHAWLSGWNRLQELVALTKGIGKCNSMLVNNFRNRAIMGHWNLIVSIDFHEHAMTSMIFLRYGYSLVFVSSKVRKPFQGMDYPRWGCQRNLEGEWLHRSTTQGIHILRYNDYTIHMHSTTCSQHIMYDMHIIPHIYQYHMYNMYTIPPVQSTTYTTCAQHHMYTTPSAPRVHNVTRTLHHLYNAYTIPHARHVCDTTFTQCHMHDMYTTPPAHNTTCTTTCTQHHMHNHADHTICT